MSTSEAPARRFSMFNRKCDQEVQRKMTEQHEADQQCIAELVKLLNSNNIEIPKSIFEKKNVSVPAAVAKPAEHGLMEDGSFTAMKKTVASIQDFVHKAEINVQYRNLTFWNSVPETKIPTVGSTFRSLLLGSGPKHRVNILNDLSGQIKPNTMTLVMGPPGCGMLYFVVLYFVVSYLLVPVSDCCI
jgi:hypothetical protein